MAETALAGTGGSVFIPGTPDTPITYIHQWDLTVEAGLYDVSQLGDYWRHHITGLRQWSGRIQGFYNVVPDTTGQLLLYNACLSSGAVVLQMQTNPGGSFFDGLAYIHQMAISDPVDNVITVDFTFTGTGTLQHAP